MFLLFNFNNTGLVKILRPLFMFLLFNLNNTVAQSHTLEEHLSVDEQIVAYKGKKSSLRHYNPRKPKKWGFKIFVLSGRSGVIQRIEFYGSVVENDNTHMVGKSGMVVVRLAKIIPKHTNFKLYFDNWFNSPELLVALAKDGIQSIGTLQPNRAKGLVSCSGPSTMPRGTFEVKAALVDGVDVYAIR